MPSATCLPYLLLAYAELGGWIEGYFSQAPPHFSSLSPALPLQLDSCLGRALSRPRIWPQGSWQPGMRWVLKFLPSSCGMDPLPFLVLELPCWYLALILEVWFILPGAFSQTPLLHSWPMHSSSSKVLSTQLKHNHAYVPSDSQGLKKWRKAFKEEAAWAAPDRFGKLKSWGNAFLWECGWKPSTSQRAGDLQTVPHHMGSLEQSVAFRHIIFLCLEVRMLICCLLVIRG